MVDCIVTTAGGVEVRRAIELSNEIYLTILKNSVVDP
jgi:hypothetical protein